MPSNFSIGQRIQVDNSKATVRYIGSIEGQSGEWVGLEWDVESRGKHDGSHQGRRYFFTCKSANSGSFVRSEKLRVTAKLVRTVSEALQMKYETEAREDQVTMELDQRVRVELVGMAKLRQQRGGVDKLQEVSLIEAAVSSAGREGDLGSHAPALEDLDLSSNLLSSWLDVQRLCQELPRLHTLNLSHNIMQHAALSDHTQYTSLQRLILNNCRISFSQELHLCQNEICNLEFDDTLIDRATSLKALALEDNSISEWEEICKLQKFTFLQRLFLSGNQLLHVYYPPPKPGESPPFDCLEALTLGNNKLTDWQSIDSCNAFPNLTSLRLSGNPHPADSHAKRFEVIARIGKLKLLNGSAISTNERKECEVQYLREVIASQRDISSSDSNTSQPHPRLSELMARYGDIGAASKLFTGPRALGEDMLSVKLSGHNWKREPQCVTKKLPGTLTISRLKFLCSKLFKLHPKDVVVLLRNAEPWEDITDSDTKDLATFCTEDTMHIEIQSR